MARTIRVLAPLVCLACASAPRPAIIEGGRVGEATRVPPPPQLVRNMEAAGIAETEMVFRVCLDERGRVSTIAAPAGLPDVIVAAYEKSIRSWTFVPYKANGKPLDACDDVVFLQRRDALDAAGQARHRPYSYYGKPIQVIDPKFGRSPQNDVRVPPELAGDLRERRLQHLDITLLVCHDASGVVDNMQLVNPLDAPERIVDWLMRGLATRPKKHPHVINGVAVRSCGEHTLRTLAE